jgi:hypothetical protein
MPSFADAVSTTEIHHALESELVLITVDTEAAVRDASDPRDVGCFGDHQSGRSHSELAEMHDVPVVGGAVLRHVLAHR